MKRLFALAVAVTMIGGFVGCTKTEEASTETTVSTPEGETTVKETTTVEKSGENPPPAGTTP